MKFPNHIILDFKTMRLNNSVQYWIFKYLLTLETKKFFFNSLSFHRKFIFNKEKHNIKFFQNQNFFTLKYNLSNLYLFASENEKEFAIKFFAPRPKVKRKVKYSKYSLNEIYNYYLEQKNTIDHKFLFLLFKNFTLKKKNLNEKSNYFFTLFDINFLRKEKIYTKLKYSRVPQYDIVAGGAAALFSGFLGFLICEKFGFELIDSGDFYILFMYLVFLSFSLRPFLRITTHNQLAWNALSYKWLILFYTNLINLLIIRIKLLLKL